MNYIDAKFEKISKYADDEGVIIPTRKTAGSAGYDFYAAEDITIPSLNDEHTYITRGLHLYNDIVPLDEWKKNYGVLTLSQAADLTKKSNAKIPLVPTGIKCKIPDGFYLQLSVRSSLPLKHYLMLGNGVGIIDADYYNNPDNEGHIYFQIYNLLPYAIKINKGDCFGQGILLPYMVCADDATNAARVGGFGSTSV